MIKQLLTAVAAGLFIAGQANAATSSFVVDTNNTIPGVTAYSILADGEGLDWTGGVILVELTQGSVYNGVPDSNQPQNFFWAFPGFEHLQWDTWFGIPGDGTNGMAGGAGDLGGGPLEIGPTVISATWFNTALNDTGPVRVGNVSVTDDAVGAWKMILSFANGTLVYSEGVIPVPEPASLALLGVGTLALMRGWRPG
ncbi:MAG: PEP-CTERM sorting domain-containing protein [Phycisphaerales bacterium]